jgi:hypothetical protein
MEDEMFLLDSLMISGIRWALETTITAAEAEMNDDTALREQLLEAEMRREMGEISDEEFAEFEADLLGRIREIKARREGGTGPLAFGGNQPMETSADSRFQIEASVSGDFYGAPADTPHTTVLESEPVQTHFLTASQSGEAIHVLDMEPGDANPVKPRRRAAARKTTRTRPRKTARKS